MATISQHPHRSALPARAALRLLFAVLLTAVTVLGFAGQASAADGYRYWNYFHLDGQTWAFSQVGAGEYQPEDGAVEGYRFGTSTTSQNVVPRADLAQVGFESICGQEQAADGQKRVAVVIDYGTAADADGATPPAPRAECAVVDQAASGQQVLQSVADVRADGGLTCAVDGYPAQGCGTPVPDATVPTSEQSVAFELPGDTQAGQAAEDAGEESGSGLLWPLVGVAVAVAVIVGATLALSRRNKSAA